MMVQSVITSVKKPTTYQEWLECLQLLSSGNVHKTKVYQSLLSASFQGTEVTKVALQKQIIEALNQMLDKSMKRFIRNLNDSIVFQEVEQIDFLFRRLKKDVKVALFFEELDCLPKNFREELSNSIKNQVSEFWKEMIQFLYEQALESSNTDLEDMLFLVKRIKLFE